MTVQTGVDTIPEMHLGELSVSKLIIGGNPFSGISHHTDKMDMEMRRNSVDYTNLCLRLTMRTLYTCSNSCGERAFFVACSDLTDVLLYIHLTTYYCNGL